MKKPNLWLRCLLATITLLVIIVLIYGYRSWHSTTSTIMTSQNPDAAKKVKDGKPFTVLVMGTDVGALGRGTSYAGNTDTMELITVNPRQKKTTIIAIPRDTLVKVNTRQGADYVKINAAYVLGGAKEAKQQVAQLLNVPVDYYVLMNMGTLEKVVNAVGGVEVNNPFAFTYEDHHFKKGKQHLNGQDALKYSRMRYDDPDNDYGRQRRGQQVIQSAIRSFKNHGSVAAADKIMIAIKDGVRTDLPINNVTTLYLNYHSAMDKTVQEQFRGKNAMIEGTSFQIATPKEINRVSNLTRSSIGLPLNQQPVENAETMMYDQQTTWDGYHNLAFRLPHNARYNQPGSGY